MTNIGGRINWVDRFLSEQQGKYFLKIDESFLNDTFNAFGLKQLIGSDYRYALEIIQGKVTDDSRSKSLEESSRLLYGLIHARYLLTSNALDSMYQKYEKTEDFEQCPNISCQGCRCLPYGEHDKPHQSKLCWFCPRCKELYLPSDKISADIDGAFFGHSYIHLFLQHHNILDINLPHFDPASDLRLFGFKVCLDSNDFLDSDSSDS